jgi:ribosome maturation factor RimP
MTDEAQITALLTPLLRDGQIYVVDTQIAGRQGGRLKVTLLLDTDAGITIEECADISRELGNQMEAAGMFNEAPFTLEVSSPGVDQPLTQRRQFLKNVGRTLTVTDTDGKELRGILESVGETDLTINVIPEKKNPKKKAAETPTGPRTLSLTEVAMAIVEIVFS